MKQEKNIFHVKSANSEISDEQYNKIKEDFFAENTENLSLDWDNEDNYENDENVNNKSREDKSYFQND